MNCLDALGLSETQSGTSTGVGFEPTQGAPIIESFNPTDGKLIASVTASSDADYEKVINHSIETFKRWSKVPAPHRGDIIRQIGDKLRHHKDALGSLVAMEMGKSKAEGDGEVQEMIDIADFAVGQSRMLYGKTMHSERPEHRMYEQWHPLGPVGVISAFNFPVAVWSWNAFIAAICGNTVIWKPSEKVPLCAIAVIKICQQVLAGTEYEGLFSLLIPKGVEMVQKLADDKRLPLISFTGSCEVGWDMATRITKRQGKPLLELGGNNAIIVDQSANLDLAIPAIVFGATGTSGQRCTTTRRLFVHETIFDSVVERLKNAYAQIKIGSPLDPKNLMGPLIDQNAVEQYKQSIDALKEQGGELLYGGNVIEGPGFFVEPTLALAQNDWPIVQQETFGPILYVMKVSSLEQAIEQQNAVSQGLSSAIFTDNLRHAEQFLSAQGSDCGLANVNIGTSGAEIGGAFGGEKATGGGREAGSDSWKTYMRRQTNTINWGNELPLAQGITFDLGE